jgi:hypothetical protein
VSGDVDSAGGRSRSATVAPRYLFCQDERRAEVSAVATPGARDVVPFESGFEVAIEGQRMVCCFDWWTARLNSLMAVG